MAEVLRQFKEDASELARDFRRVAEALDEHTERTNYARVAGGGLGVVGGGLAITGLIAMPFTAGVSALVLGIGGAITGAAGGMIAGGAGLARYFIEKNKFGYVRDRWSVFCRRLTEELRRHPELLERLGSQALFSVVRIGMAGVELSGGVGRAVSSGARVVETTAARVSAVAGFVTLDVVLIGFSLYDIVEGAIEIHRNDGSIAGNNLRKLAESLDRLAQEEELEAFVQALREIVERRAE